MQKGPASKALSFRTLQTLRAVILHTSVHARLLAKNFKNVCSDFKDPGV